MFFHDAQETMGGMVARMDGLKKAVEENISGFQELQGGVQNDKAATQDLLTKGKAAQQVKKDCLFIS